MMHIGIGITTHNRREQFLEMLSSWRRYRPDDCRIVVVDDGSDIPVPPIDGVEVLRNDIPLGISAAKNRTLSALRDCEHVFLSDDDVAPVSADWWRPYVESRHEHMSLTFCTDVSGKRISHDHWLMGHLDDGTAIWSSPNGCLLYMTKHVIDTVGGYDQDLYPVCGAEHRDYSSRVFYAGLTQCEFMDVPGSLELFRVLDREGVASSTTEDARRAHYGPNTDTYLRLRGRATKVPIRPIDD
ncbi:glycosyltransferase [Mycobacterium phage Lucky2013]|nr:glycosyltransferase [Mycobacterium phage Lucky2013]